MSKKRDRLEELTSRVLDDLDSELYLLKWEKRGKERVLELLIDKEGAVTTADCAEVSQLVSDELEREELIRDEFVLQVSSPGLERPLVEDRHYRGAIGETVEVNTYAPVESSRNFVGSLISYDEREGEIELEVDGRPIHIPLDSVSKATTKYDDDDREEQQPREG